MIPITDIRAWGNVIPWKNDEQVEQDLVISRSLVEIYSAILLSISGENFLTSSNGIFR